MKDKIQILGSPLGMYSLLREDYIISVLRDEGSLDERKLNALIAKIANMGANGLRDFFWIDTQQAYEKISPFRHEGGQTFTFNGKYFDNQGTIARVCNHYGMRYYLTLFDHCGTKRGVGDWNPWRFFSDFFYGEDAKAHRHKYIDRVFKALAGADAGVEVCNEPKTGQGQFLADTFIYLIRKGFDPRKIILGNDYHLKEKNAAYGRDYREFRDKVAVDLDDSKWQKSIKTECISPVHNATIEGIDDLWGPDVKAGGDRRVLYSMDGVQKPRPDRNMMYGITKKVLEKKAKSREEEKVLIEVVYGKTNHDPLDSLEGVSQAYKEIWGAYPANYGKYKDAGDVVIDDGIIDEPAGSYVVHVIHGYRGLLGRDADPGGLEDYVDFLEGGGTILQFCHKLVSSEEFVENSAKLAPLDLAHRFYKSILEREPDELGLEHTAESIRKGEVAERAAAMLESREFQIKFT
ncbi:MAG: DUF4214 domain-containing protein [bacterium]|nr:DUF4214 domain-containing protein [bacterium]